MKTKILTLFIALAIWLHLVGSLSLGMDYDIAGSLQYFKFVTEESRDQLKTIQSNLQKYQTDPLKSELYVELQFHLEILIAKVLNLNNLYYLYDRLQSCTTEDEKRFIHRQAQKVIEYYSGDRISKFREEMDDLRAKKMDMEYENYSLFYNRVTHLSSFIETSLRQDLK